MSLREVLLSGAAEWGLELSPPALESFEAYYALLSEMNRVMDLTAVMGEEETARRHFLDALALLELADFPQGARVVDVGTGAGFPGVPLKIAVPSLELTLLDSLQKRMNWLENEALPELGIEARFLTGRAEDFAKDRRECFDVVTSRAVARLNLLCELCLPYVRVGGCFLALKGAAADQELREAERAIRALGGSYERTEVFPIGGASHQVLVIRKTAPTAPRYPRPWSQIKKKPL